MTLEFTLSQEDVDECDSDPCLNGGACTNGEDMFECTCVDGWTGDKCQNMLDTCEVWGNHCDNSGTCWSVYNATFCA